MKIAMNEKIWGCLEAQHETPNLHSSYYSNLNWTHKKIIISKLFYNEDSSNPDYRGFTNILFAKVDFVKQIEFQMNVAGDKNLSWLIFPDQLKKRVSDFDEKFIQEAS